MPQTLTDFHATQVIKLLNMGESGSAKTGQLASLAIAGYNLYVLDYDNGIEILANVLRQGGHADALARVHFETIRDTIIFSNGTPKIKPPTTAFRRAGQLLAEWDAANFTPADIIVLDTLTTFSEAGFNEALSAAGRLNQRPQQTDYGWMGDAVMLFIEMLTSPALNCHVIVNSHIRYFSGDDDMQTVARGLPNAKGQQIPTTVSRYFNTCILSRSIGSGPATKRVITTQPQGVVGVKTSAPTSVKASYPIETGLASLFQDILGTSPQPPKGT